jgi:hypothetical protein
MKPIKSNHQANKMISLTPRSIDRRHVLKGFGAAIALPLLNAMSPTAAVGSVMPDAAQTPKRIAFCYAPNGMIRQHWFPAGTGNDFELTQTLQPLEGLRNDLVLLDGLDRSYVGGADPHSQSGSCWMTSSRPEQQRDGVTPIDVTLDQVIARQLAGPTAFPSLEISCNTFTDNLEPKIFDAISWYGPGHDAPSENNPIELFRRLFGQSMTLKSSVLDVVLAEVGDLKKSVGVDDRRKVDEYLQSIRAVEKRIYRQQSEKDRIADLNLKTPESVPVDRGEYIRLMGDMMVLAFQTDMTRVASFMIGPERWQTPQMYDGVFENPMNHHEMTHDHNYDEEVALIDRFHVQQFAYMINKMKSIREGDGTLFDNSLIVFGSGLSDGAKHSYKRLPTIVAGGGEIVGGGRRLTVPEGTPLANLWLTVANQMGVKADRFADSSGVVKDLFGKAGY